MGRTGQRQQPDERQLPGTMAFSPERSLCSVHAWAARRCKRKVLPTWRTFRSRPNSRPKNPRRHGGTWNRTHLEAILVAELARAERYHQPLSLLIIDVDHFKSINDAFGHLSGDAVLIELTRRIRAQLRSVDVLARWGGEEFVVLLPQCGAAEGRMVAEKLRALVADQPFPAVGRVTASFGLAQFQPAETLDSCLHRADEALYAAKYGGRNRVCVATDQVLRMLLTERPASNARRRSGPSKETRMMLRMLRASTPVESFCEVVRMVGMVFLLSWKSRRYCSPRAPSSAVTLW